MHRIADVHIIGAGLIGLASALALSDRGARVVVHDAREPAKAASWAGAGMLAPYSEDVDDALFRLCVTSLERYPAFAASLHERTGIDVELRRDGHLHVAFDARGRADLDAMALRLQSRSVPYEFLDRDATIEREPILGIAARASLFITGEAQVDNRRLGRALLAACNAAGVRIVAEAGPVTLEADDRRVRGLRTSAGFVAAPVIVNAAGAWAGEIDGVPAPARVPVTPVGGQMISLAIPRGLVQRVVWANGAYFVPRGDGRLLVGATVEDRGFDARVTAAGVRWLLEATLRSAPSLGDFTISETWAGVRPASADGRPFLGATAVEGYFVAAGHYRNGILLTPVTADVLADAVEGRPSIDLAPFAAGRAMRTEPPEARAKWSAR